jgi:hypothetical protein
MRLVCCQPAFACNNPCLCLCRRALLLPLLQLDVAVEIIGERSLRIEELEEDISDMKAIFHTQLNEAAKKLAAAEQAQQQQQQQQPQEGDGGG